jgi:hypothetical protein
LIKNYFESSLFSKELGPDDFNKMLEYNPIINARAHTVGDKNQKKILNKTFRQTYDKFLQTVAYKPKLEFEDVLIFVYYLQL